MVVGFVGCTGGVHSPVTPDPPPPTLLGEVEWLLQAAVDEVLSVDARALKHSYDRYMSFSQPGCPPASEEPGWLADCMTGEGVLFYGNLVEGINSEVWGSDWQISGAALVDRPGEALLEIEGTAGFGAGHLYGVDHEYQYGYGQFREAGARAEGWLAHPLEVSLFVQASRIAIPEGARALSVGGSLDGLAGRSDQQVEFVAVEVIEPGWPGAACTGAPTGEIRVQLPEGGWVSVDFGLEREPRCDGCAQATFEGILLGEICADFSGWLDWDVSPWVSPVGG